MRRVFTDNAWDDYLWWQAHDRKTLHRINLLIEGVCRNGNCGIGKPEPLRGEFTGFWSRRINDRDRLVYRLSSDAVEILACRFHYTDR